MQRCRAQECSVDTAASFQFFIRTPRPLQNEKHLKGGLSTGLGSPPFPSMRPQCSNHIKTFAGCLAKVADGTPRPSEGLVKKSLYGHFPLTVDLKTGWEMGRAVTYRNAGPTGSESLTAIVYRRPHITIERLPDYVLLEIFDFYRISDVESLRGRPWRWQKLVHICRRWRLVVFASPLRLALQLTCSYGTPVRKLLGCWPPLPLAIEYGGLPDLKPPALEDEDNIVAALQHPKRIWKIELIVTKSLSEKLEPLMQEPFPILSHLEISHDRTGWVFPSTFLDGNTPRLRVIHLYDVAFPALPRLHLSVNTITSLGLVNIPSDGYFSPEAIIPCLSMLTQLETLSILFQSPILHRDRSIPPLRRAILPSLISFGFRGTSEYLEDLVAKLDAPLMAHISIKFFNQLVFEVPQLFLFIGRAKKVLWAPTEAVVYSSQKGISIGLTRGTDIEVHEQSRIEISCRELDWQVSSVAQICGHASLLLSCVERLDIRAKSPSPSGLQELDVAQWLELFHSFRGMKELQANSTLGPMIESALQQAAAEAIFGVFPALRRVHLGKTQLSTSVEQFIAACHLPIIQYY